MKMTMILMKIWMMKRRESIPDVVVGERTRPLLR